jgi:uncharacterized flavoprotein (TIGR03862 family)
MQNRKKVAIIGSGPSALMLAAHLDETKFEVHLFEKNAAPARKFLVAGDGGFNLTHSEDLETFISRYTPSHFLAPALRAFSNDELRAFLLQIGIPSFVGTSKRVYPEKGIKPIDVLNAFLNLLKTKNVSLHFKYEWLGENTNALVFKCGNETHFLAFDLIVFALGGASWPVTGTDGSWAPFFAEKEIQTKPFLPSNCTMLVDWPKNIIPDFAGQALKNISVTCAGVSKKGECVITESGIEGGAVYFHSASIRNLLQTSQARIVVDFRPDEAETQIKSKLFSSTEKNPSAILRKTIRLSDLQLALIKSAMTKEEFADKTKLAALIKKFPLIITGTGSLENAISSVGGIALEEIDSSYELKKWPNHFAIGEMLDWDAPTGGYLLQACFSMGFDLAKKLNAS